MINLGKTKILPNDYPLLKRKSISVRDFESQDIVELCEVMLHAMAQNSLVGISAVQVGKLERVICFVMSVPDGDDKILAKPIYLINPEILERSDAGEFNDTIEADDIHGGRSVFPYAMVLGYQQTDGEKKTIYVEGMNSVFAYRQIQYLDGLSVD